MMFDVLDVLDAFCAPLSWKCLPCVFNVYVCRQTHTEGRHVHANNKSNENSRVEIHREF